MGTKRDNEAQRGKEKGGMRKSRKYTAWMDEKSRKVTACIHSEVFLGTERDEEKNKKEAGERRKEMGMIKGGRRKEE